MADYKALIQSYAKIQKRIKMEKKVRKNFSNATFCGNLYQNTLLEKVINEVWKGHKV